MHDMYYTYPKVEIQRLPGYRTSDPALNDLFEALYIRKEREKSFDGDSLPDKKKAEYLISLGEELQARAKALKYQYFECGRVLCEAKKHLPHGEFQPWVENHFEHGYRTGHNCMKVYEACMGHPEVVQYFNPSCLYLIAKPSFPEGLREALFDGARGPVDVSKKELVQVAMKFKNGEVSTDSEEVQKILKKQRDITIWERYKIELKALGRLIDDRLEKIKRLFILYPINPLIAGDREDCTKKEMESDIKSIIKNFRVEIHEQIRQLNEKCK